MVGGVGSRECRKPLPVRARRFGGSRDSPVANGSPVTGSAVV